MLACACGAYLTFCISSPDKSWNCRASDNREVSSSSSWLLDHQHIKKRRRDRTRLRSLSVANVSTSARTRPLHSFQKRKLYRMHRACYWNQQVGLASLFRRQNQRVQLLEAACVFSGMLEEKCMLCCLFVTFRKHIVYMVGVLDVWAGAQS